MLRLTKIAIFCMTLPLASTATAQDVVRLATEGAYAPYNYINDNGEIDGFEREFGDAVCERASLDCSWITNEWDSIIPNLVSGNYDVIIAGMSITDERDEVIDFTVNYTQPDPTAYLVNTPDVDYDSSVIAAQINTIEAAFAANKPNVTLVEFATLEEAIAAVVGGEADAVLADKGFLLTIVEGNADLQLLEREEIIGGGIGMGVRESDVELREKLNMAIMSMRNDGSLNELLEKWLPEAIQF